MFVLHCHCSVVQSLTWTDVTEWSGVISHAVSNSLSLSASGPPKSSMIFPVERIGFAVHLF